MKVLFVGACPSRLNTCPLIAFAGSRSEGRLNDWISLLGVKDYLITNASPKVLGRGERLRSADFDLVNLKVMADQCDRVIALGNCASRALRKAGIPHYKMPHPSPRNRKLNDKEFIYRKLVACRLYLAI